MSCHTWGAQGGLIHQLCRFSRIWTHRSVAIKVIEHRNTGLVMFSLNLKCTKWNMRYSWNSIIYNVDMRERFFYQCCEASPRTPCCLAGAPRRPLSCSSPRWRPRPWSPASHQTQPRTSLSRDIVTENPYIIQEQVCSFAAKNYPLYGPDTSRSRFWTSKVS